MSLIRIMWVIVGPGDGLKSICCQPVASTDDKLTSIRHRVLGLVIFKAINIFTFKCKWKFVRKKAATVCKWHSVSDWKLSRPEQIMVDTRFTALKRWSTLSSLWFTIVLASIHQLGLNSKRLFSPKWGGQRSKLSPSWKWLDTVLFYTKHNSKTQELFATYKQT